MKEGILSQSAVPISVGKVTLNRVNLAHEFAAIPDHGLATTGQVAAFLNWSESKLERDRCQGGGIPFIQLGRTVRYQKSVVMAHVLGAVRVSTSDKGARS